MALEFRIETGSEFDFDKTADIARRSFGKTVSGLSSARFAWTYRIGFEKIITVSAFLDGSKIGQVAAIVKPMMVDGQICKTAELVDLFVAPEHRSLNAGTQLYKELRTAVAAENIDLVYAYANENATVLNKRFFHLKQTTIMPINLGLSFAAFNPLTLSRVVIAHDAAAMADLCRADGAELGGIVWGREQLQKRLQSPVHSYLCASHDGVTILASPRIIRSVPVLMLCASFVRPDRRVDKGSVRTLISALCQASRRPLYFHAGWNDCLDLTPRPSIPPYRFERKFSIQSNFLESQKGRISRFELLDIDYG